MPGDDRFEIFPVTARYNDEDREHEFMFRVVYANEEIGPVSMQRYRDREDANRGIHDFLDAVDPEGAGTNRIHAPIIDVEE